ncbi:hypothetical protein R3I94_008400 [Phoxinus phoxinus]
MIMLRVCDAALDLHER